MKTKKTFEIIYKTYSKEVMGYILRLHDLVYLVINTALSKSDAERAEKRLTDLADSHPPSKLILLYGDGKVYETDNLDFLERAC